MKVISMFGHITAYWSEPWMVESSPVAHFKTLTIKQPSVSYTMVARTPNFHIDKNKRRSNNDFSVLGRAISSMGNLIHSSMKWLINLLSKDWRRFKRISNRSAKPFNVLYQSDPIKRQFLVPSTIATTVGGLIGATAVGLLDFFGEPLANIISSVDLSRTPLSPLSLIQGVFVEALGGKKYGDNLAITQ